MALSDDLSLPGKVEGIVIGGLLDCSGLKELCDTAIPKSEREAAVAEDRWEYLQETAGKYFITLLINQHREWRDERAEATAYKELVTIIAGVITEAEDMSSLAGTANTSYEVADTLRQEEVDNLPIANAMAEQIADYYKRQIGRLNLFRAAESPARSSRS